MEYVTNGTNIMQLNTGPFIKLTIYITQSIKWGKGEYMSTFFVPS